jgi:hypothetical protein
VKTAFGGKFIVLNAYIRNEERSGKIKIRIEINKV